MKFRKGSRVATLIAATIATLGLGMPISAQESIETRLDRLEKQNEALAKQNQELINTLQQRPTTLPADGGVRADDVRAIVGSYLTEKEQQKKADDKKAAAGDYAVGSDLKMTAKWNDGLYLQTANKDFYTHIGGWVQNDYYWWTQSGGLLAPKGKAKVGSPPAGGIGALEDGDAFRRIRLQFEGGFWEVFEYNLVPAFENNQFDTAGLDEFWFGITKVPVVGNIRVGHVKIEQGLEGDMVSSSRTMTFLERASYTDAFYQNFGTGLWVFNSFWDDRATLGGNVYRQDRQVSGDSFGDGEYAYAARATALPWYENNGRCLLHLGSSFTYHVAQLGGPNGPGTGGSGVRSVQFRSRPEMRDTDPAGATSDATTSSNLGGNNNRLVDTTLFGADAFYNAGAEFLLINGPLSVQGEYALCTATNSVVAKKSYGDLTFNGGYVQVGYFLTGENRSYDKRLGRLDSYYIGRQGPNTPYWAVRGDDGRLNMGLGAWEVSARYSYLDLNDGPIHGGVEQGVSVGLNWILNNNMKVLLQYQFNRRESLPAGVNEGDVNGIGARFQLVF